MSIKQLFPGFLKQFRNRAPPLQNDFTKQIRNRAAPLQNDFTKQFKNRTPPLQNDYLRIRVEKSSLTEWPVLLMEAP
jgi:hypothetical protein